MTRPRFLIGDRVPEFSCESSNSPEFFFDSVAGRFVVLTLFGSSHGAQAAAIDHISGALRHYFDDRRICFFGVSIDPRDKERSRVSQQLPGIRFFWDFDRKVSILYGALDQHAGADIAADGYDARSLVLDPNLRILADIPMTDVQEHNAALSKILQQIPDVDLHAGVPLHAPVLIVPRIFEPAFCRFLIDLYEKNGGRESGFMTEEGGLTIGKVDHQFKRRKDFLIQDERVMGAMRVRLAHRLVPEIERAFQFRATRIERYIVACYDAASGGFFRPHRDNTTAGTAHRQFACSINLNAEEYAGGDLRFPEFGSRTYRAPTGGAVVFSCSLLHEATPVTRGVRYATLPFLYNDVAAELRQRNAVFLDPSIDVSGREGDDARQSEPVGSPDAGDSGQR